MAMDGTFGRLSIQTSVVLLFLLTTTCGMVSAGETYIPGPEIEDTLDEGESYTYTLPDSRGSGIYITKSNDNIGYDYWGKVYAKDMYLEITIRTGEAQTYYIEMKDWEFVPDEIIIKTGSTLVFNCTNGTHNIVLPWDTPEPEEESGLPVPGFGMELTSLSFILALLFSATRKRCF